jgi:hypothetical protein
VPRIIVLVKILIVGKVLSLFVPSMSVKKAIVPLVFFFIAALLVGGTFGGIGTVRLMYSLGECSKC